MRKFIINLKICHQQWVLRLYLANESIQTHWILNWFSFAIHVFCIYFVNCLVFVFHVYYRCPKPLCYCNSRSSSSRTSTNNFNVFLFFIEFDIYGCVIRSRWCSGACVSKQAIQCTLCIQKLAMPFLYCVCVVRVNTSIFRLLHCIIHRIALNKWFRSMYALNWNSLVNNLKCFLSHRKIQPNARIYQFGPWICMLIAMLFYLFIALFTDVFLMFGRLMQTQFARTQNSSFFTITNGSMHSNRYYRLSFV